MKKLTTRFKCFPLKQLLLITPIFKKIELIIKILNYQPSSNQNTMTQINDHTQFSNEAELSRASILANLPENSCPLIASLDALKNSKVLLESHIWS